VVVCPTNIVVVADAGQCAKTNVTWGGGGGSDNCAVAMWGLLSPPPSGLDLPPRGGASTVTCTATDAWQPQQLHPSP